MASLFFNLVVCLCIGFSLTASLENLKDAEDIIAEAEDVVDQLLERRKRDKCSQKKEPIKGEVFLNALFENMRYSTLYRKSHQGC